MQGMRFLLLGEKGAPINHGTILQKVTDDRYLCFFARVPSVSRLCHVEEISGWNLFPDEDALNTFLRAFQAQTQPPNPVETDENVEKKDDAVATIEPEESEDVE